MTQLFISYSRKDIAFARRLAGDLEKAGYAVWWDITDLRGGDDWIRVIPEAIASSDFFIVVLTPNSTVSEWVRKEYTQAVSLHKKIIPLMLERTAMPFALNTLNYLDFTSEAAYAENLNALLLALGYTGEMPVVPAEMAPRGMRSLAIPILVSVAILVALGAYYLFSMPPVSPATVTPTPASHTATLVTSPPATGTSTPSATATSSPTDSPTRTPSLTATATHTATATATIEVLESLPFCVSRRLSDVSAVNVRRGPGTDYPAFEEALRVGKCLTFSAVSEDGLWLLIAGDQADPEMQKFEGGWVRRDLLVPGVSGTVNLPVFTLTPTPIPSGTPTITPSLTPSDTPTGTHIPTETETPAS